jgi:hypothetical protein
MAFHGTEKQRRIDQFAHYLRLMRTRTQKIVKDDCFITFDELNRGDGDGQGAHASTAEDVPCPAETAFSPPDAEQLDARLITDAELGGDGSLLEPSEASRLAVAPLPLIGFGHGGHEAMSGDPSPQDPLDDDSLRYCQFAFQRDCFCMDLPNNTVFYHEANLILQQRGGFYYALSRPDLPWVRDNWKDTVEWNPLQKIYIYRDEESAAEDMTFIWFDVWRFPLDARLYVYAASFATGRRFEWGVPIE